jgi:hypothetical protein
LFVNKTTIYVGLVLFLRVTSYSRERSRHSEIKLPLLTSRVRTVPALRVTSAMGVLFTTGIQVVMVVLFPNGGSTTVIKLAEQGDEFSCCRLNKTQNHIQCENSST